MRIASFALLLGLIGGLAACGDNGTGSTTAPATGSSAAAQQIREHLQAAGQEVRNAATEAATEVGPALRRAKEEARETVHDLSQKIADRTAPASATQP
ncbi:MAG TPA: hypothetical protein VM008_03085 [Phycisphaerae bacterium]|nr:hypothetical protein [Phycisphaerae bacterium]